MSLLSLIRRVAPTALALEAPRQQVRWSYGELHQRVRQLAGGLRELGVGKGDVVASDLPNVCENLLLQLAVAHLGASFASAKDEKSLLAAVGEVRLAPNPNPNPNPKPNPNPNPNPSPRLTLALTLTLTMALTRTRTRTRTRTLRCAAPSCNPLRGAGCGGLRRRRPARCAWTWTARGPRRAASPRSPSWRPTRQTRMTRRPPQVRVRVRVKVRVRVRVRVRGEN